MPARDYGASTLNFFFSYSRLNMSIAEQAKWQKEKTEALSRNENDIFLSVVFSLSAFLTLAHFRMMSGGNAMIYKYTKKK